MTDTSNPNEENDKDIDAPPAPKIIVDSDWKEQVAKEKEAAIAGETLAQESPGKDAFRGNVLDVEGSLEGAPSSEDAKSTAAEVVKDGGAKRPGLPEPSFEILVSMLFTQALSALGQMPNPVDGETSVDKPMAKHSIDMLEMLGDKTKGNLSEDESKMLGEALHALRMTYVGVRG